MLVLPSLFWRALAFSSSLPLLHCRIISTVLEQHLAYPPSMQVRAKPPVIHHVSEGQSGSDILFSNPHQNRSCGRFILPNCRLLFLNAEVPVGVARCINLLLENDKVEGNKKATTAIFTCTCSCSWPFGSLLAHNTVYENETGCLAWFIASVF